MRNTIEHCIAVAALIFVGACGGSTSNTVDGAGGSPDMTNPAKNPDMTGGNSNPDMVPYATFTQVKTIFPANCGGIAPSSCHLRSPVANGLDLTAANAWSSLVNAAVVNTVPAGIVRVKPFDETKSFLWMKLNNLIPQDMSEGVPMPKVEGGTWHPLPTADLDLVLSWIRGGALNN